MPTSTLDTVRKIASEHSDEPIESITSESELKHDLGMDSLDIIELGLKIDTEFLIEIPDKELEAIKTVGDMVAYIEHATPLQK